MRQFLLLVLPLFLLSCQIKTSEKLLQSKGQNEIAYTTGGKGEAIVFIHAGGLDKNMWKNQLNVFKKDYKVIAYDIRGHGQTQTINESIYELDDLLAVLQKENLERAHLVGLSFGAIIALDFVLAYPDKVDKLVLASPGLVGFQEQNPEFLEVFTSYYKTIQNNDEEGMLKSLKRLNAVGKTNRTLSKSINEYVESCLSDYIEKGSHLRVPKLKELQPVSKLASIKTPTLILFGELDYNFNLLNALELAKHISQSNLRKIKDAGHLINLEQPEVFNKELRSFLN